MDLEYAVDEDQDTNNELDENPRKRAESGRTRTPCEGCSRRRIRCDKGKPQCNQCKKRNETCVYTVPNVNSNGFEIPRNLLWSTSKVQNNSTLYLLGWPKIRELMAHQHDPQLLLQLEMKRERLNRGDLLSLDTRNNHLLIEAFFDDANIWYACVNPSTWEFTYNMAKSHNFRDVPESCLVLLVLALGTTSYGANVAQTSQNKKPLGIQYFSAAWGILCELTFSHDILALQCIVLASAYLFYLVRPLEAWTLLSGINTKLQLHFSLHGEIPPHSKELRNRLVWNAILFETDLLHELDLPQSSLIYSEASPDLPSDYSEDYHPYFQDQSYYLSATISLFRLRMRIHQAIYGKDAPTTTDALEPIAADFGSQLSQWISSYPFARGDQPALNLPAEASFHPAQISLYLRIYAIRALIFRPFLVTILNSSLCPMTQGIHLACTKCLESCVHLLEYFLNIDYETNHYPYVWQDALLAVNGTLQLMGASMATDLAGLLPSKEDLDGMIDRVMQVMEKLGEKAPSLKVIGELLREAESTRREVWGREESLEL